MKFLLLTRGSPCDNYDLYPSVKLDSCALFILNFLSKEPETRDKEVVASKLFYFSEKFCCRSGLSVADVTVSSVVGMTG